MAEIRIGTSGWNYDSWKDDFYEGVRKADWLAHCGERFTGIEVNATFYRQQEKRTFEKWRDSVPEDFAFAVKGNRYLTHSKNLKDPEEPVGRERERASALGEKLAAVLWQLPSDRKKNLERVREFARVISSEWNEVPHAIEFRNRSWFDDDIADCLREHGVGLCISDAADWPMWEAATSDLVYVRLHGHTRTYASSYSASNLGRWADRIRNWTDDGREVHVYFDNDTEGAAPKDAMRLLEMLS